MANIIFLALFAANCWHIDELRLNMLLIEVPASKKGD